MDLSTREGRREQGLLIQKVVERAGLSVEELAKRIGCSRALIYQYVSGTTLAQPDRLQQIASETGVPLAYFFGGDFVEEPRRRKNGERESAQARLTERLRQLEELATAQERPTDWGALVSTSDRIIGLASQMEDAVTEARALLRQGKARIHLGEFSRGAESLSLAAELYAEIKEEPGEADARQALGNALLALGRMEEAREQFTWVAASGRWAARWSGAVSLAAVDEELGEYRRAMERCDEAAAILDEGKDAADIARGLLYVNANRVNLYMACGDFKSAAPLARQCGSEAESFGDSGQHLEARLNIAFCAYYQGSWAEGYHTLGSALRLARFVGDKSRESMCRAIFALLLAAIGDYSAATAQAKDALSSALSQGDHRSELFAQMALADAYAGDGRDSEARYHANQALAVTSALRLALYQAECRLRLARLSIRSHDMTEAADHLERAIEITERIGARHVEARGRLLRADWRLRAGAVTPADADVCVGLPLARALGLTPLEWEGEALRARIDCAQDPPNDRGADETTARAVALIEQARMALRDAGISDTLLEDRDRQEIYLLRAKQLMDMERGQEAAALIHQAGWPPLAARFGHMS